MATTLTITRPSDLSELDQLLQRLKAWRARRARGERIPNELWKAATDLARSHGLNATASALKLGYYALQQRLLAAGAQPTRGPAQATFIELPAAALPLGLGEPGTLELVQAGGSRLTLRVPNASPNDFLPVVELFLRQRP